MRKIMTMFFSVMLFTFVGLGVMGNAAEDPSGAESMQQSSQYMQEQQPMTTEGAQSIRGTITLVGNDQINVKETATGMEHQIRVNETQEAELTTGYDITALVENGKLVSYTLEGVPPNVKEIVYTARNLPDENILEQQPQPRMF
ncbi:MAG: hypothetical protein AB1598_14225 [Thermodesulfobacteriota bacterium]